MFGLIPSIPKYPRTNPFASNQAPIAGPRSKSRSSSLSDERPCSLASPPASPAFPIATSPAKQRSPMLVINSLSKLSTLQIERIRQAKKFIYRPPEPDLSLHQHDILLRIRSTDKLGVMRLESIGKNHPAARDLAILQRKLNTSMVRNFIHASRGVSADYLNIPEGSLGSTVPAEKQKLAARLTQCHAEMVGVFDAVNRPIRARIDQQLDALQKEWHRIEDDPESGHGSVDLVLEQMSAIKELTAGLNCARAKVAQHIKVRFLVARQAASTITIDVLIDSLIATLQAPCIEPDNLLIGGKKCTERLLEQRCVECFLMDRPSGQNQANISRIDELLTHALVDWEDKQRLISLLQDPDISLARLIELINTLEHNKAQAMIAQTLRQELYTSPPKLIPTKAMSAELTIMEPTAIPQQDVSAGQDDFVAENLNQQEERVETLQLRCGEKERIESFLSRQIYCGPWFDRGANGKHKNGKSYYTPVTYLYIRELGRLRKILADPEQSWTRARVERYIARASSCVKEIDTENRRYCCWFNLRYWTTFDTLKDNDKKEISLAQYRSGRQFQELNTSIDMLRKKMNENMAGIVAAKPSVKSIAEKSKNLPRQADRFSGTAARLSHFSWLEIFKFWKW